MRVLQLGTRCNNACVFCAAAGERELHPPVPTTELLFDALDSVPDGETLAFVGGEPTLHDDLPSLVRRAKRKVGRVVLQTNARRLAYPSYAESLAQAGVDAIDVSLHGSTEAMHDYHTSVAGSFRQTLRGAANGASAGMSVVVTCVVTRSNFRHLAEVVAVAQAIGAKAVRFQAPRLSGRALLARDRIVAHTELVVPYLKKAVVAGRTHGIDVVAGLPRGVTDFVPFVADQVGGSEAASESGAQVLPCLAPPVRANPGLAERRVRDRQTGPELRNILPSLFEPPSRGR
jgi:MoaA/NifB/PqqE/SkfB family radical SAM enzyme